jgi:hypothetical protein
MGPGAVGGRYGLPGPCRPWATRPVDFTRHWRNAALIMAFGKQRSRKAREVVGDRRARRRAFNLRAAPVSTPRRYWSRQPGRGNHIGGETRLNEPIHWRRSTQARTPNWHDGPDQPRPGLAPRRVAPDWPPIVGLARNRRRQNGADDPPRKKGFPHMPTSPGFAEQFDCQRDNHPGRARRRSASAPRPGRETIR